MGKPPNGGNTNTFVDQTRALKKESMMRRNKLTLEHIMHERGKHVAEDKVLAQLHEDLRNAEKREKGPSEIITVTRASNRQSKFNNEAYLHSYN